MKVQSLFDHRVTNATMPSHWANAHGGRAARPRVGEATPSHPYKPLGPFVGPLSHRQEIFFSLLRVGAK